MAAVRERPAGLSKESACEVIGLARSSFYYHETPRAEPRPRPRPARALSGQERGAVLELLHSEAFVDMAPSEVYATLLDKGIYHCGVRTMYRVLHQEGEVRERRDVRTHASYVKPELLATGPNEVWSWDITLLPGPAKWNHFRLYVILDIFSRYVVGWMVAEVESTALAKRLIDEACDRQGIKPGQLVLHSDRGPAMRSKGVSQLLAELGVTKTHSRPHVSDDNPFSEAQFKTLKYRPEFPRRFGSLEDARGCCRALLQWYNHEHHHSGLALLTPEDVHYGRSLTVLAARQAALDTAYRDHPERFVHRAPRAALPPESAWINPPKRESAEAVEGSSSSGDEGLLRRAGAEGHAEQPQSRLREAHRRSRPEGLDGGEAAWHPESDLAKGGEPTTEPVAQ